MHLSLLCLTIPRWKLDPYSNYRVNWGNSVNFFELDMQKLVHYIVIYKDYYSNGTFNLSI